MYKYGLHRYLRKAQHDLQSLVTLEVPFLESVTPGNEDFSPRQIVI